MRTYHLFFPATGNSQDYTVTNEQVLNGIASSALNNSIAEGWTITGVDDSADPPAPPPQTGGTILQRLLQGSPNPTLPIISTPGLQPPAALVPVASGAPTPLGVAALSPARKRVILIGLVAIAMFYWWS